jgi:F-type H+-transporting ATPase subunit epsilon
MALQFSILCPHAEIAKGEASQLTAPGMEGQFGVLENHAPFASLLRPGCLIVEQLDGKKNYFYVRGGFARATAEEVVVLADEIIKKEELNESTIRQAVSDSKDDIANLTDEKKLAKAKKTLREYEAQLSVIESSTNT